MNLPLEKLETGLPEYRVEADVDAYPELLEAGSRGRVSIHARIDSVGDRWWVRLKIQGELGRECGRCLEAVGELFTLEAKLLVERRPEQGLAWMDLEDLEVEEYQVVVGPDVRDIPLQSLVAEQLVLNFSHSYLPELDNAGKCVVCGKEPPTVKSRENEETVDPRWEKLRRLRDAGNG